MANPGEGGGGGGGGTNHIYGTCMGKLIVNMICPPPPPESATAFCWWIKFSLCSIHEYSRQKLGLCLSSDSTRNVVRILRSNHDAVVNDMVDIVDELHKGSVRSSLRTHLAGMVYSC